MIIPLPGGGSIDIGNDMTITSVNSVTLHTPKALGRLIEFWRNKPNLRAWLSDYTDEIQTLENVLWDVITSRLLDFAGTDQLNTIGSIVGEPRNGLGNTAYRIRIKARIAINNSLGRALDVIHVLRMITITRFRYVRFGVAAFRIEFLAPPETTDLARQIPSIVEETCAAGVWYHVVYNTRALLPAGGGGSAYGWYGDLAFHPHAGYGWSGGSGVGGKYAHAAI